MAQTIEEKLADMLLEILQNHRGEWVSDVALRKELASNRLNSLQTAALEDLAFNGQIYIRAVERGTTPGAHYEYKAR